MSKKLIIYCSLLFLMAVFSFLSWQSLNNIFFGVQGFFNPVTFWIMPLVLFLILAAIFGLLALLADSFIWPTIGLAITAVLFIFILGAKIWFLIAALLGFGFAVWVSFGTGRQKNIFVKISPIDILKPALSAFFTAIILITSVVLSFSSIAQNLSVEIKIPRPLFDVAVNSAGKVLQGQFGLESADNVLDQATKDALYEAANKQAISYLGSYKRFLPYGLGVAVFITLYTMKFIFGWLALAIIEIAFYLMKKTGLVKMGKIMVEKETIEI